MARVEQITDKAQIPSEWHSLFDRIVAQRGRVAGPYSIMLYAPALADRVDQLSGALRSDVEVTAQEHALTATAVARAKDCLFVWSVQVPNARRAGVSDEAIAAIRERTTVGLSDDQRDIVSYATQLATASRVDAATFERLKQRHGVKWLVELTMIAGHFGLICGINNAFEVPASSNGEVLPV
jgi:4-carboxymuconolactone decarboxylase